MITRWHGDGDFAECTMKKHSVKFLKFAECQAQNTRQTLPGVISKTLGKVLKFVECQGQNTQQRLHILPSVTPNTLGKQARNG